MNTHEYAPRRKLNTLWVHLQNIGPHPRRTYDVECENLCIEFHPKHGKRWINHRQGMPHKGRVLGDFMHMNPKEARAAVKPIESTAKYWRHVKHKEQRARVRAMKKPEIMPVKRTRGVCPSLPRYPKPPSGDSVYFLLKDDVIVYIGVAKNVGNRIPQHHNKDYDTWTYVPDQLNLEEVCIRYVCPKYNKQRWSGKDPCKDGMALLRKHVPWIL